MADEIVIDTTVLQKANAVITTQPGRRSRFARRIKLLQDLRREGTKVLFSKRLLTEYRKQVRSPRNDFVRLFFEILDDSERAIYNWAKWSGQERDKALSLSVSP